MHVTMDFNITQKIKDHEGKIKKAFAAAQNLERFTDDDKIVALGHLKVVCFFAAEDFIRAQTLISSEKGVNHEAT